jgi:two-component system chemotaxis response regulator CheY
MFPKDIRILVVDDMSTERKKLSYLMKDLGYENIVEATDGLEGLKVLEQEGSKIGLVMSDLNMPNLNGLDFLKKIRTLDAVKDVPFMIFSTESEREIIIEAMISGCSGYLIKPVQPEDLKAKLGKVFARSKTKAA